MPTGRYGPRLSSAICMIAASAVAFARRTGMPWGQLAKPPTRSLPWPGPLRSGAPTIHQRGRSLCSRPAVRRSAGGRRAGHTTGRNCCAKRFRHSLALHGASFEFQTAQVDLERVTGLESIVSEHHHGVTGELRQILADEGQLLQDVVWHGDDMTGRIISLKDI